MFKWLPKSKLPTEMLYFLVEDTLIVYVQFIIGFKRKTSSLYKKSLEKDSEQYGSDSIFKRLNFVYSSSKTVSNQRTKLSCFFFLVNAYFRRSD